MPLISATKEQITSLPDDYIKKIKFHTTEFMHAENYFQVYYDANDSTKGTEASLLEKNTLHFVNEHQNNTSRIVYYIKENPRNPRQRCIFYCDAPTDVITQAQEDALTYFAADSAGMANQAKCFVSKLNTYLLEKDKSSEVYAAIERLFNPYNTKYKCLAFEEFRETEYNLVKPIKTNLSDFKKAISTIPEDPRQAEVKFHFASFELTLLELAKKRKENENFVINWMEIYQACLTLQKAIQKNYPYSNLSRACNILGSSLMGGIMAKFLGISGLTLAAGVTMPGWALGMLITGTLATFTLACYHIATYTQFMRSKPSKAGLYKNTLDTGLRLCETLILSPSMQRAERTLQKGLTA